jgi:hypothetical protein
MLSITDLCDNQIYVESEGWQCSFGYRKPIRLGLILEAIDKGDDKMNGYTFVVDACIIPQPENIDEEIIAEAKSEGLETRTEQIRYAYECYGVFP